MSQTLCKEFFLFTEATQQNALQNHKPGSGELGV